MIRNCRYIRRFVLVAEVAGGALVVGVGPDDVAGGVEGGDVLIGQDLVDCWTPEVAVDEVRVGEAVELVDGLDAIVGEEGVYGRCAAGAVGIGAAVGPAVSDVVFVLDGFQDRVAGVFEGDGDEAVAVVPSVFFVRTGRNGGLLGPISLVVVFVVVRSVTDS